MTPTINRDINALSPNFRKKFDLWWAEVVAKYPNAVVFETKRSQERQNWLYEQGRTKPGNIVTWTLTSNHKDGNAVDIVFEDPNGKLTWIGPYSDLIEMAKKYGIASLSPKEVCHFEDNGKPFSSIQFTSPADILLIKKLVDAGVYNGTEGDGVTHRVVLMVAKLYDNLSKKIQG